MKNSAKGRIGLIILFLTGLLNVGVLLESASGQEPLAKYSKVRVYANSSEDILSMNKAGLAFDHIIPRANYFDVVFNDLEMGHLKKTGVSFEILVDDLETEYQSRSKLSQGDLDALEAQMKQQYGFHGFEFGSMGGYYTYDEVVGELDEMVLLFPNLITAKQSIGTSIEGRDLWMVKISDNPNVEESEEEILYTALMHAREPQGMASVVYFMWYMLENYGSDAVVDFLVDNRELYFVPVINPDGYVYNQTTNPNGGGNWRKNRRDNGGGIFGVDINRNFAYEWGFDDIGSSPNPSSGTYRGTAPVSEPETQAIQDFVISRELTMTFNYHAVAGSYNFPWGYLPNFFTPDQAQFVAFSQQMSTFNNFIYGTPWSNLGYVTNGYSNDWFYGEQTLKGKIFSWTVEVGGSGFWPSENQIIPLAVENIYGNFVLANGISGGMPPAGPVVDITVTPAPGDPVFTGPQGTSTFFTYDVTVDNNGPSTLNAQIWNTITIPIGEEIGPIQFPTPGGQTFQNITVPAGESFNQTYAFEFPPAPPPGTYIFNMNVGTFPNIQLDRDTFAMIRTSSPGLSTTGTGGPEDWEPVAEVTVAADFSLGQNYPNPFNPSTTISYELPTAENTSLSIYDLSGRQVTELVNEYKDLGRWIKRIWIVLSWEDIVCFGMVETKQVKRLHPACIFIKFERVSLHKPENSCS